MQKIASKSKVQYIRISKRHKSPGCVAWRGCLAWLICDGINENVNRPMSLEQYALLVSCPWLLAYVQHALSHSTMYSFVDHHMWPFPNNVLVLPCGWCCWWQATKTQMVETIQSSSILKRCELKKFMEKFLNIINHEQIRSSITMDFWHRDDRTQYANVVPANDHIFKRMSAVLCNMRVYLINKISYLHFNN